MLRSYFDLITDLFDCLFCKYFLAFFVKIVFGLYQLIFRLIPVYSWFFDFGSTYRYVAWVISSLWVPLTAVEFALQAVGGTLGG